jgi:asparagine synthase (glutamine-hydrolysing)
MDYSPGADPVDAAMRTDVADYLAGDILVKTDRAAMASSLELRAPFLDVDLASFCLTLPSRLKLNGRSDKLLLRRWAEYRWPVSVRKRAKQGFAAPVHVWLQWPEFDELRRLHLETPPARERLATLIGDRLVSKLAGERTDRTWSLLMLSMWMQGRCLEF